MHSISKYLISLRTAYCTLMMLLAATIGTQAATPPVWKVQQGKVTFSIRNAGLLVNGSLGGLKAEIHFDPTHPEQSTLIASVQAGTIDTGIGARDKHLRKEVYLDADRYPLLTMRSVKITATGANTFQGQFELTIKGTTQQVSLPFTFREKNGQGIFAGECKINRLDYGVGSSSWLLGDEVTISIKIDVTQ